MMIVKTKSVVSNIWMNSKFLLLILDVIILLSCPKGGNGHKHINHPTSAPTNTENCEDYPASWYDSGGPQFTCAWYGITSGKGYNKCEDDGDLYENFGKTANHACCVCGGGTTSDATSIPAAGTSPTSDATSIPAAASPTPKITMTPTLFSPKPSSIQTLPSVSLQTDAPSKRSKPQPTRSPSLSGQPATFQTTRKPQPSQAATMLPTEQASTSMLSLNLNIQPTQNLTENEQLNQQQQTSSPPSSGHTFSVSNLQQVKPEFSRSKQMSTNLSVALGTNLSPDMTEVEMTLMFESMTAQFIRENLPENDSVNVTITSVDATSILKRTGVQGDIDTEFKVEMIVYAEVYTLEPTTNTYTFTEEILYGFKTNFTGYEEIFGLYLSLYSDALHQEKTDSKSSGEDELPTWSLKDYFLSTYIVVAIAFIGFFSIITICVFLAEKKRRPTAGNKINTASEETVRTCASTKTNHVPIEIPVGDGNQVDVSDTVLDKLQTAVDKLCHHG